MPKSFHFGVEIQNRHIIPIFRAHSHFNSVPVTRGSGGQGPRRGPTWAPQGPPVGGRSTDRAGIEAYLHEFL